MSTQPPSTQEQYDALPLGTNRPSFAIFGNSSKETVLQACRELHLNAFQTMTVEDVWTRHPVRQTATTQVPSATFDDLVMAVNALKASVEESSKKPSRKSGGSQQMSQDYKRRVIEVEFNSTIVLPDGEAKEIGSFYENRDLNTILQHLRKTTASICQKINKSLPNVKQKNQGDEISIIQEEILSLCDNLVEVCNERDRNIPYTLEDISIQREFNYITNSSSSAANDNNIDRSGRIDITFHTQSHKIVSIGMIECKKSDMKFYKNKDSDISHDGNVSVLQSLTQLESQLQILNSNYQFTPSLFISLITNGCAWILLRQQVIDGVPKFFHSQEIVLIEKLKNEKNNNEEWSVTTNEDSFKTVLEMILFFLYSFKCVQYEIKKKVEYITPLKEDENQDKDHQNRDDDDEAADDDDDDEDYGNDGEDGMPPTQLHKRSRSEKQRPYKPNKTQKKETAKKNLYEENRYARLTENNLAFFNKIHQLVK